MLWLPAGSALALSAMNDGQVAATDLPHQDGLDFDLPTQSLASALQRYAVIADQTVLFSDALVAGRQSAPVKGRYTAPAALAALLTGTGVVADNPDGRLRNTFVLKLALPAAAVIDATALDRHYDGLVQTRVWEALCADARTVPGNYRASLRLHVDSDGRLVAPRLIGSTGDSGRDQAMIVALNGLRMGHAPPPDLRQPLMLVILPSSRVAGRPCGTGNAP